MKVIDPGHEYIIEALDGGEPQTMRFVKRVGINYPGNTDAHGGPITQEYLRAIIHRCVYMQSQRSCAETAVIINSLRTALLAFEVRAARCRGAAIELPTLEGIEEIPTCPTCGHIQCDRTRHAKPHWSTEIGPRILPPDAEPAPDRFSEGYDHAIRVLRNGRNTDLDFPRGAVDGADYLIDHRERALAAPEPPQDARIAIAAIDPKSGGGDGRRR